MRKTTYTKNTKHIDCALVFLVLQVYVFVLLTLDKVLAKCVGARSAATLIKKLQLKFTMCQ